VPRLRGGGALNRPGNRPRRAGQAWTVRTRRHGRNRGRVRLEDDTAAGMTGGPRLSAAAAWERGRWAGDGGLGQLGQKRATRRSRSEERKLGRGLLG
jgi:hypothetical protein